MLVNKIYWFFQVNGVGVLLPRQRTAEGYALWAVVVSRAVGYLRLRPGVNGRCCPTGRGWFLGSFWYCFLVYLC